MTPSLVDTIGLAGGKYHYIDSFRMPHTDKLHVVERFTISKDGKTLTAIVSVEDIGTFNAPLTLKQTWRRNEAPMAEMVCAENETEHFASKFIDFARPTYRHSDRRAMRSVRTIFRRGHGNRSALGPNHPQSFVPQHRHDATPGNDRLDSCQAALKARIRFSSNVTHVA